jgi:hypothetical protein
MRAKSIRPLRAARDRDTRWLTAFLVMLAGRERGGLLEFRARRASGRMAQRFYPGGALRRAAAELLELGERTDVYVGCAPRLRPAGDATAANGGRPPRSARAPARSRTRRRSCARSERCTTALGPVPGWRLLSQCRR